MLFKKGASFYAFYNLRLFFYLLFHKADVLLSNDLDTLLANHWAKKFKSNCKLVYDSHEYFVGVPELTHKPGIQKIWRRIEKKCLPKTDQRYTVNESIATLYKSEYGLDFEVVRNISDAPKNIQTKSRSELAVMMRLISRPSSATELAPSNCRVLRLTCMMRTRRQNW